MERGGTGDCHGVTGLDCTGPMGGTGWVEDLGWLGEWFCFDCPYWFALANVLLHTT